MAEQTTRLKIGNQQGISIVEFSDRKILDELCIHEIQEELSTLVESHPGAKLLLCFKNVEHLSSAALGKLVVLRKKVEGAKGKLALSNIDDSIFEAFKITGFDRIFKIFPDEQEALQFLQS